MSDQQFRRDLICAAQSEMTRRDIYICAAIEGVAANFSYVNISDDLLAAHAIHLADAALAAAGGQESVTDRLEVANDQVSALMEQVAHYMAEAQNLRAEIARLKRLAEPLTEEEKRLAAKEAHGHLVVRDLVALDLTNPNFSVRLFVAMIEQSITAVKNRRA